MSLAALESRVRSLRAEIRAARDLAATIPDTLRGRVFERLDTALHRLGRRADRIALAGDPQPGDWAETHLVGLELLDLAEECLALAGGAQVRLALPHQGWCDLADVLLDDIVSRTPIEWSTFTVPAVAELMSRRSGVVRVRFPSAGLWELPIVAHEVGHFLGVAITDDSGGRVRHPFEELVARAVGRDPRYHPWLHELFADACAAWTVGPAYPMACARLRFDPVEADLWSETHPSPTVRLEFIRDVLSCADPDGAYKTVVARVLDDWRDQVAAAGNGFASPPEDTLPVAEWVEPVVDLLDEFLAGARWDGWWPAQQWREALIKDVSLEREAGLRDLVNAAWLARLSVSNQGEWPRLHDRAVAESEGGGR